MAYSRNEYLQSLNRMRANYQNQGNPLINRENDDGSVGNELSAFAYMQTDPTQLAPEQASKAERNGWQRTVDTVHSGISNVTEGVTNFIDDVWDFAVVSTSWLTGLFSGIGSAISGEGFEKGWEKGTEWTQPVTTYEWEQYLNQWWNQMDIGHAVLTGDMFTGEWEQKWAELADAEKTKQNIAETHKNSWANERGEFGQGLQKFEQGVGYVLPSLVLAYFTGGASLGAQVAIQAGVMGASAMGGGFEQATKEGATYGQAMGYGATKGAISAGTTAVLMGIGGSIASKTGSGVAGKIADKVVDKTGSVIVGRMAEAGFRATTSAGRSALMTAVEPMIKQITYDGDAIEKAYGNNEAIKATLKQIGENAMQSAIISASISAFQTGKDIVKAGGKSNYEQQYFNQRALREAGVQKELNTLNRYNKDVEKLQKQLLDGKITEDQFVARVERLNAKHGEALQSLNDKYSKYMETHGDNQIGNIKYATQRQIATDELGNISREAFMNSPEVAIAKVAKANGMSNEQAKDLLAQMGFFKGSAKNVNVNAESGKMYLTVKSGGESHQVPLEIDGGSPKISPTSGGEIYGAITAVSSSYANKHIPNTIEISSNVLKMPDVKIGGIENGYKLTKDVSSKILNKSNFKEISKFLETGLKGRGKDNYVIQSKDKGTYTIVEPYQEDGLIKYGIIKINSKTNEIIDISVKADRPTMDRAYIVPKMDEQKLLSTKLENKDGTAIVYDVENADFDWDISDEGREFSINAKVSDRHIDKGGFVYSKNPLRVADFKKEIPFARLSKVFNIPASLEKTYNLKLKDGTNELSVLKWVGKRSGLKVEQVLEKLGYDSIVKSDNSVTFFKAGNILRRGVEFSHGKRSENYSDLIKRNVSEDTRKELAGYTGENGKELVTEKDSFEYSKLVRETLNYSVQNVNYNGETSAVKIINKKAYTPDMLRAVEKGNKIGVKTSFALRLQEADNDNALSHVSAFWSGGDKDITIFVDSGRRGTLTQTANHELGHGIFDKLHGWELLNIEDRIKYLEKNHPIELLKKREQYCEQWNYDPTEIGYDNKIYEEMFVDTYAGLCEWEDKAFQNALIKDMDDLYAKGSKWANHQYYKILANEEAEDRNFAFAEIAKSDGSKLNLAITATEDISLDTYKEKMRILKPKMLKATKKLTRLTGIPMKFGGAIGGYVFNDGSGVGGEPSLPVYFDANVSDSDVEFVASLLGTSAYEYQQTVGTVRYDDAGDSYEDTFALNKVDDGVNKAIIKSGLKYYTLDVENKKLVITQGDSDTLLSVLTELKNGGYLDVNDRKEQKCAVKWLGANERASICKNWLQARHEDAQNGELRSLVQKCYEVDTFVSQHELEVFGDWEKGIEPVYKDRSFDALYEVAHKEFSAKKIISDLQAKSSTVLIEAGADVSKDVKYRLDSVKQAFDNALKELVPENASYKLNFSDAKQSFAELNLARPKDRAIAVDNLIKRLKETEVTSVDVFGEEKFTLGDLLSVDQEKQAREIMLNTLKGKAEPTKLAKWSNALHLQKIKTYEGARSFKLMNRIQRKIKSGTVSYLSSPTEAVGELTLYDKIIENVTLPFSNESLGELTKNVALYYTENNFGKMLANFDIPYNSYISELNEYLASTITKGKPLTAVQIKTANDILQLVYNDLKDLGKGVVAQNRAKARDGVVLAQALVKDAKDNILVKGVNVIKTIDHSIRSPISVATTALGEDHPLTVHLRVGGKECENNQREILNKFKDQVFKDTGIKNIDKAGAKKVEFMGRKIKTAQALKILNTALTAGEDFYKRGGSWTVGGKRVDFKPTPEQIEALKNSISKEMNDWNKDHVLKFFDGDSKTYVQKKFKDMNSVELQMVEGQYYPTSAVGDKIADLKTSHNGSISPSDWGLSFLKERVSHTDAPYNLDGDVFKDTLNYIQRITQWGEWAEWYHNLKIMENTRVFGQGTSLNAVMEKSVVGWKDMMDFVHHTALGIAYDNSQNLLGKIDNVVGGVFQNLQQVAMMDLFTQIKTLGSDFTGWQFFGTKNVIKGLMNYWRHGGVFAEKKASAIIDKYSPTLRNRHHTSEAFSANIGKVAKSKVAKAITSVVRILDWHIHCKAFYMAQEQAKSEGYTGEDSINERAVRILENYSDTTQPTTSKFNVGMYRSGANGKIVKQGFGMFQSMGQNIWQGLISITVGWRAGVQRIKAYEQALIDNDKKIQEYKALEDEARERMNNAETDEEYEEANKAYEEAKFHREGHEKSKDTINDQLNKEKARFTVKGWFNKASAYLAGLIGSGLILTLIAKTKKKVYGKEEWSDWDVKDLSEEAVYNSFVNWIPYVSTIANAIKNDSDLTIFTVDNMNEILDAFTSLYKSISEGDGGHIAGSTLKALTTLSAFFGIPAKSLWNLLNGIWYNADHGSNITFKNWLGMYSASYLRTQYKDAYEKGEHNKAIANLEVWTYNYSIETSPEVLEEIYRLNKEGYTGVAPSAIPTSYTNEKGETVKFTTAQATAFKTEYAKADKDVARLMQVDGYSKLDDKTKASLMKRIYSAYRESAQAKALGTAPNSKLAQLIYYTNGDVDLAKYILSIQNLSVIKDDEKQTRKEKVVAEINKMKGFTKEEKLLLAYLSGYKLSEKNQTVMFKFLMKKGFSKKDALAYLKIETE